MLLLSTSTDQSHQNHSIPTDSNRVLTSPTTMAQTPPINNRSVPSQSGDKAKAKVAKSNKF